MPPMPPAGPGRPGQRGPCGRCGYNGEKRAPRCPVDYSTAFAANLERLLDTEVSRNERPDLRFLGSLAEARRTFERGQPTRVIIAVSIEFRYWTRLRNDQPQRREVDSDWVVIRPESSGFRAGHLACRTFLITEAAAIRKSSKIGLPNWRSTRLCYQLTGLDDASYSQRLV